MKKNKKLLKTVATSAFACLCTAALATGIIAATQHNVNISTSVSFSAQGVSGTLTGTLKGHTNGSETIVEATAANKIIGADVAEANKSYSFTFNNSNANQDWAPGALSIATNDDGLASTLIYDFVVTNSGSNNILFALTLSDKASTNLSIQFASGLGANESAARTALTVDNQNVKTIASTGTSTLVFQVRVSVIDSSITATAADFTSDKINISLTDAPATQTTYGVTYFANTNGAKATVVAKTVTTNETLAHESDIFTWTGHTFGGWYTDSECTAANVVANLNNISANKVLYAKWTPTT